MGSSNTSSPTEEAYATLLYGDFLIGTRVLGQSIRNTGTKRDYLALCTESVSEASRNVLSREGWKVVPVKGIANMFSTEGHPSRFTFTITKLAVWNLTMYRRIILIDSDAILLRNIDHLFRCGVFCAAFRHSDLFNTGVIVIKPSNAMYEELLRKTAQLQSYDSADQGFLNSAFSELKYATMFDPKADKNVEDVMMRLPAGYNMDIGIYYISGHWSISSEEMYVLHYTLGPVKPWVWWSYPLFDQNWYWHTLRRQLPSSPDDPYLVHPMSLVPMLLLAVIVMFHIRNTRYLSKWKLPHPSYISRAGVYLFYWMALPLALLCGFLCVPNQLWPLQGYVCFYLWSLLFLTIQYTVACNLALRGCDRGDLALKPGSRLYPKTATFFFLLSFTVEFVLVSLVPYFVSPLLKRAMVWLVLLVVMAVHSYVQGVRLVGACLE